MVSAEKTAIWFTSGCTQGFGLLDSPQEIWQGPLLSVAWMAFAG
jgi:hypothetical protein